MLEKPPSLPDMVATTAKIKGATSGIFGLTSTLIGGLVFIGIGILLVLSGGVLIGCGLIFVTILVVYLNITAGKKALNVNLYDNSASEASTEQSVAPASFSHDEKIVGIVPGIMQSFAFGAPIIRSTSFGGTGEIEHPENVFILTNKHILLIYVPVAGGDKIVGGIDMGHTRWLMGMDNLKEQVDAMLATMSLDQVYRQYPKNIAIPLVDVTQVDFSDWRRNIVISTKNSNNYSYAVRTKETFESLKQLLRPNFSLVSN